MSKPYFSPELQWAVEHIDLPKASRFEGARWEDFQIQLLNTPQTSILNALVKPRQVGYSWMIALMGVVNALLNNRSSIVFSYREEDAQEKLKYVEWVLEGIRGYRLPSKIDINTERAILGKSTIKSRPSKGARGSSGVDIYADEGGEIPNLGTFLTAAIPIISKSGRFFLGGTPKGAFGAFYEVCSGEDQYKTFTVVRSPWWEMYAFSNNVELAKLLAPTMDTETRVRRFANERIQLIYETMILEDFQQEYELLFIDGSMAFFPTKETELCLPISRHLAPAYTLEETDYKGWWANLRGAGTETSDGHWIEAKLAIDQLAYLMRIGVIKARFLLAGYDVGREINTSELCIGTLELDGKLATRILISLDDFGYEQQKDIIRYAMRTLAIVKLTIDATGLGNNLGEDMMKEFGDRVASEKFTLDSKNMWVTTAKKLVQKMKVIIIPVRQLIQELSKIRRKVSAENRTVKFDVPKEEKYHADKAWSFFLMCAGTMGHGTEYKASSSAQGTVAKAVTRLPVNIPKGNPYGSFNYKNMKGRLP